MPREPEAYTGQTLCGSGSRSPLRAFLRTETGGAAVLVAAALAALLWANAAPSAASASCSACVFAVDPGQRPAPRSSNHQRRLRSPRAVAFYRRQGWTQATHPSPEGRGIVVFLGPCHPARTLAALPF